MLVASALQVCSYFVLIDFWPCLVNPPSSSCFKNTLFRFLAMTMNRKPGVLPSAPNTVFPTQTELSGQTAQENRHGALVADKHFRHGWAELRCATWWVSKTWYECACSVVCDSLRPAPRPMDRSTPGSSVYRIFQTGILEWVAISFSPRYA